MPEARGGGQDKLPPHVKSGVAAETSYPMSKEQWLHGCRRVYRSYPTLKVRKGGGEEIPPSKVRSNGCTLLEQP